jgi:hypothetical protein
MSLYTTASSIKVELEATYKNLTGKPCFSAAEADIVNSSILDAIQEVMLEYGISDFQFIRDDITQDTISGQAYVDLTSGIFRVVSGSVRIPAYDQALSVSDEEAIFAADPDLSESGLPQTYTLMASDDPDVLRLRLWPAPDAVYTIYMTVMKIPTLSLTNNAAVGIANMPQMVQSAIKYKAKALACMQLGSMAALSGPLTMQYESIITKIKNGYRHDGPLHIQRISYGSSSRSIESRCP